METMRVDRHPDPRRLQAALAVLLDAVLARGDELLSVKDAASGRYLHVNTAMAQWLGHPGADVVGHTDAELLDAPLATAMRAAEQAAMAHVAPLRSEHHCDWRGSARDFDVLRLLIPADLGVADAPRWLCAVWTDLAPQRRHEDQLRTALAQIEAQQRANDALRRELANQAVRDAASGLATRSHFDDQVRREVDLSMREHREFAIVFIDIDPPTPAVQALGEPGRRRVLDAVGRLLRGGTRAMDASCLYDEQRFAVLLSGVGLATAHSRMEGLRRQCATQIVMHEGQALRFTVAMGVASFPHTAHTQEELVVACEAALAEARRRGGNHVTLAAIRFEALR